LEIKGQAGSINAVANFITQLKRSGYFDNVEIKEASETDLVKSAQTFGFSMTAAIASAAPPEGQAKPQPAGGKAPAQPAAKGRG
jgi:Tfp pilus assembly protein PilN